MLRKFTIGREKDCDVPIADDSVSRLHAEIWRADDGAVTIADRGSSNGTTLIRAGQSFPLRHEVVLPGDQVRFGGITLGVSELIQAIEVKHPGALSSKAGHPPGRPPPPPPKGGPQAQLVRCECGAIKNVGQICPGCHR